MARKSSVDVIYAVTKESLATQQAQKSALESKASTVIGFAGGMIALLMGARDTISSLQSTPKQLVFISISLFVISILLATIVGWVRKYRIDPNPSVLAKNYLDKPEQDVQLQLVANLIDVWETNSRQIERNATVLRIALMAQTLAFTLLGIVLVSSIP